MLLAAAKEQTHTFQMNICETPSIAQSNQSNQSGRRTTHPHCHPHYLQVSSLLAAALLQLVNVDGANSSVDAADTQDVVLWFSCGDSPCDLYQ